MVTKIMGWFAHPNYSDGTLADYGAAIVLILMVAFLWNTTVKQTL